jgi:GNAT superfamily N-acetyltransferase
MVDVTPVADETEERLSLDAYVETWPHDSFGLPKLQAFKTSLVDHVSWADRPDLARGIYEVSVEASPDVPGYEEEEHEPFAAWLAHDMSGPSDRPEATLVALAGDEVVGYAKLSLSTARPTHAYHDLTAVKRAWRGRGVARSLKATQIGWAKANGFEELRTQNDERNEPIRRLNAEFGYAPAIGRIFLRGPLA